MDRFASIADRAAMTSSYVVGLEQTGEDRRQSPTRSAGTTPVAMGHRDSAGRPRDDPRMQVIVLNGTSSAGKSTLASSLQTQLADVGECWIIIGIDDFLGRLPPAWVTYRDHVGEQADQGMEFTMVDNEVKCRIGPVGERLLVGYRGAVAAVARAGINVIVDEVLFGEDDWKAWQQQLGGLDVLWVAVMADRDVVEQRERDRSDRMVGLARSQHEAVHRHVAYDVRVDTAVMDPAAAAAAILAAR